MERVQDRRLVTGELRAAQRAVVAAREPGLVSEVLVREGAAVQAGMPLVRLDASLLEAELAINAAERVATEDQIAEREAQKGQVDADLAAIEALIERRAANPKELSDARALASAAAARLAQARSALEVNAARRALLEKRLADMTPSAPFEGYVVTRSVERGQWVAQGGELFEVVSAGCQAWLDVPQSLFASVSGLEQGLIALALVSAGCQVWFDMPASLFAAVSGLEQGSLTLALDGGLEVSSLAQRVVREVAPEARTFQLIIDLAPDPRLAPGMSVWANVPTGAEGEALTVHRDGILRNEVGTYIYVAMPGAEGEPHHALFVPVEVLFYAGQRAVLRVGALAPGALVVVEGNERLFPSAPLIPSPWRPAMGEQGAGETVEEQP